MKEKEIEKDILSRRDENMVRYARLVFEEEVQEDLLPEKIADRLKTSIRNWLKVLEEDLHGALEDIEISEYPYERQE
jgi:DNA replication protein DnaD